jgi:hypothetical protein
MWLEKGYIKFLLKTSIKMVIEISLVTIDNKYDIIRQEKNGV